MKVIGLTGGIGSGKTTIAGFFKKLGVPLYIADDAGKRLMATSQEVKSQIIALLGQDSYCDDIPDRRFIADVVFKSPKKLEQLNQIIHPAVQEDFENWKNNQNSPYVLYEAAILFETGGYKKCDAVILVTAPLHTRIERLQLRDGITLEQIEARMHHQWSDKQKRKLSQFEIFNANLLKSEQQVKIIHDFLLNPNKN
ncbi:dephospho-CoA kinase [soil metagenome]